MMYKLTLMMLAAVATGVQGSNSGEPTIVGGAPAPSFGAFATNGFGTGYMSSSGHFTFQNADQPAVSGAYIYHTCDPYTPGAYYALLVSTGVNSDGSAAFIDQASCEHGAFSYASDGKTLQWTFALGDPDFSTPCQALPSEAFAAPATASRIARVPDTVSTGTFCGLNFY
eukprot:TRINITY_DN863_c0_g2_i5.p1 TRINITY_DN863_c0_g2~~TRINITY_DN863_c0_g2_i5.p1  ORF type:complete len:170 (-),score=41.09 TRINITY_DN863_c0_g2_i5:331-840(-)